MPRRDASKSRMQALHSVAAHNGVLSPQTDTTIQKMADNICNRYSSTSAKKERGDNNTAQYAVTYDELPHAIDMGNRAV